MNWLSILWENLVFSSTVVYGSQRFFLESVPAGQPPKYILLGGFKGETQTGCPSFLYGLWHFGVRCFKGHVARTLGEKAFDDKIEIFTGKDSQCVQAGWEYSDMVEENLVRLYLFTLDSKKNWQLHWISIYTHSFFIFISYFFIQLKTKNKYSTSHTEGCGFHPTQSPDPKCVVLHQKGKTTLPRYTVHYIWWRDKLEVT